LFAYPFFALTRQQLKTENNKLNIYTQYLMKSTFETIWLFFHRPVGLVELFILYTTGFGLPPYFKDCEGYYVIIWLIVRICVFIKEWKLIYSELFILKRKRMENWGGSWHKLYSMHLPVKHTWFFCLALVQDKKISHC
jgi:hypothetical protein